MRKPVFCSILLLCVALAAVSPAVAEHHEKSLYDRLGGAYPIALVVDDFIDRVVDNDTLNANPEIYAARDEKRFPGLKFQVTSMVCMATGGPCSYTGMTMKDAHEGMKITAAEWDSLAADFQASLDHFGVGEAEQKELFAIVGSVRGDIVVE